MDFELVRIAAPPEQFIFDLPIRAEVLRKDVARLQMIDQRGRAIDVHVVYGWRDKQYVDVLKRELFLSEHRIAGFEEAFTAQAEHVAAVVSDVVHESGSRVSTVNS